MMPSFELDGSLCLFSSYFHGAIPGYTKNYVKELRNHMNDLLFITNEKELSGDDLEFLQSSDCKLLYVENMGYDFGMYHEALQHIDTSNLQRLALVNDSNLLVRRLSGFFEWLDHQHATFVSMLDSNEIDYHLKSDFLVFQGDALALLPAYFNKIGVLKNKKKVIRKYEVGLSQFFLKKNVLIKSFFQVENYEQDYQRNPSFYLLEQLLDDDYPLVKKKVLTGGFEKNDAAYLVKNGFSFNQEKYLPLIKSMNPTFEPPNS